MASYYLPVDIKETDNGYLVEAPVPGLKPEDVEVTFSDGVLSINASRREEREEKEGRYLRREIAFGNYQRRIALPGDVQAENITARFDDGVLRVEVPRATKPEPRRIEVQQGEQARQDSGETSKEAAGQGSTEASSQPTEEREQQPVEASSQS